MDRRLGLRIGFLIHDVSRLRRAMFAARSRHLDITRSESWVLTGISRRRSGLSQTELANVLGLGKVATGEFIAGLERKGFVVRRLDARDRRVYRVQPTPSGRAMLAKISAIVARINEEIFAEFSDTDVRRLAGYLGRLKHHLADSVARSARPEREARRTRAPRRSGSRAVAGKQQQRADSVVNR